MADQSKRSPATSKGTLAIKPTGAPTSVVLAYPCEEHQRVMLMPLRNPCTHALSLSAVANRCGCADKTLAKHRNAPTAFCKLYRRVFNADPLTLEIPKAHPDQAHQPPVRPLRTAALTRLERRFRTLVAQLGNVHRLNIVLTADNAFKLLYSAKSAPLKTRTPKTSIKMEAFGVRCWPQCEGE